VQWYCCGYVSESPIKKIAVEIFTENQKRGQLIQLIRYFSLNQKKQYSWKTMVRWYNDCL